MSKREIDSVDKRVIQVLQEDFPLVEEPYKELALKAGITEKEFLHRVRRLSNEKKIRKMGAVLRHREVGFEANALCAWEVPKERIDEIAMGMSSHPAVSHCYDRDTAENWPFNLYTMIHAHTREECEEIAEQLARENGVAHRIMLYSKKEWKKTSMKYFCEG